MDRRGNSDDEVVTAALKLMGYEWTCSEYTGSSNLYLITKNSKLKARWVLPNTTTVSEIYEYISRLK